MDRRHLDENDVRNMAITLGCRLPRWKAVDRPGLWECWRDRVLAVKRASELDGVVPYRTCEARSDADLYAGWTGENLP